MKTLTQRCAFACLCGLIVAACAQQKPEPAKSPPAPGYPAPGYPAQPQYQNAPPPLPATVPTGVPDPETPRRLETVEDADAALGEAEKELDTLFDATKVEELGDMRCVRACKALASMARAVDRLCELTDGDERCEGARTRLDRVRRRVEDAGCNC